jgi:Transglutaminase-like superfamily
MGWDRQVPAPASAGAASGGTAVQDFYTRPSAMTSAGRYAPLLEALPGDVTELTRVVQGLGVYDAVARDFYGFAIPDGREAEIHIRPVEGMLERLLQLDDRPLSAPRPVARRLVCRCRNYTLLLLAMLRAKGIPARARCGFGTYFNPPCFEDHWACEYWRAAEARWALADPQFDEVWRAKLNIRHDILDVPRDRFLVAGDAWAKCHAGQADPSRFGIQFAGLRGLWFIAGSIVRDLAALNGAEMLPWDVWGCQPRPGEQLNSEQLAFFDRLAQLSQNPDGSFDDLRRLYNDDERLRVPATVFNALRNRPVSTRSVET